MTSQSEPYWLGRFVEPHTISEASRFRVTSAIDPERARRVVVVSLGPVQSRERGLEALAKLAEAHQTVQHPMVAPCAEVSLDEGWVLFDIPARLDLTRLLDLARGHRKNRIPHAAADAFIYYLREGLSASAVPPKSGVRSFTIGEFAYGNALLARDGRFWLLGLGHNVVTRDEMGQLGGCPVFASAEVGLGGAPSAMGDYIALIALSRSLMPFTRLAPAVINVASRLAKADFKLLSLLRWYENEVLAVPAENRPTVERCVEVADEIRDHLGIYPDLDGFERAAAEVIADCAGLELESTSSMWTIGENELRASHATVSLRPDSPAQRIVEHLLTLRCAEPGATRSVQDLVKVGWPGERLAPRSGANRVYVAINALRRQGLGSDLESATGGYRLSPAARFERAGSSSSDSQR